MDTTPIAIKDEISVLIELGLTISEARVYLSLVQTDISRITHISKVTGIHRENLYKTIRALEAKGLIEKELGPPTAYRAIPPKDALRMLTKHKRTQITELEIKTKIIGAVC